MVEKILIVGLGQVGQALFELFERSGKFDVYGLDLDEEKMQSIAGNKKVPKIIDFMHICYPCTQQEEFVKTTLAYIRRIKPKLTIVESTVPPGTTSKIWEASHLPIVHSPIRGMHKSLETMERDIQFWSKYVGGATRDSADVARRHFERLGLKVKTLRGPAETELAKLFETIYRAWMIACFQEMHRISRNFKADFNEVVDMLEDIHRVRLNKPIHFPGIIGGHCLIPNTKLLLAVYDSDFLRLILKSNEKREKEFENEDVREEVERVRKRAEKLEKKLVEKTGKARPV